MKEFIDTLLKNLGVSLFFGMSVDLTIDRYSLNVLLSAALRFAIKLYHWRNNLWNSGGFRLMQI